MKIVVLDAFPTTQGKLSLDRLKQFGDVEIYDRTPKDKVIERCMGAEAIIINKINVTAELLDRLPEIKYVGLLATGYNVVDIDACRARNVTVCNVPSYSTMSVAQTAIALLLEITTGVGVHNDAIKKGDWFKAEDYCFLKQDIIELDKKVIGIIGYGDIGRATARIANSLGMKVLAYNRHKKPVDDFVTLVDDIDEIYKNADVISLHVSLNKDSKNLINRDAISKMKKGVILINTARGGLIDETALHEGLTSGKIYAFGADVLANEPPLEDNLIVPLSNSYLTPHIAWASEEARQRLIDVAIENVECYIKGTVKNKVS